MQMYSSTQHLHTCAEACSRTFSLIFLKASLFCHNTTVKTITEPYSKQKCKCSEWIVFPESHSNATNLTRNTWAHKDFSPFTAGSIFRTKDYLYWIWYMLAPKSSEFQIHTHIFLKFICNRRWILERPMQVQSSYF